MKYGTWTCYFAEPEKGHWASEVIHSRGYWAEGAFYVPDDYPYGSSQSVEVGYYDDDADTSNLDSYNFTEITQAEALEIAQTIKQSASVQADGRIWFPPLPA